MWVKEKHFYKRLLTKMSDGTYKVSVAGVQTGPLSVYKNGWTERMSEDKSPYTKIKQTNSDSQKKPKR